MTSDQQIREAMRDLVPGARPVLRLRSGGELHGALLTSTEDQVTIEVSGGSRSVALRDGLDQDSDELARPRIGAAAGAIDSARPWDLAYENAYISLVACGEFREGG